MNILKWLFGTSKKDVAAVVETKKNINNLHGSYKSYNDHYETIKRKDNSSNIVEDVVIGMAVNSVIDSIFDNSDSSPNYSGYDNDNSSHGFSSGFGGGDYSGGGSSGDWSDSGSSSDSSSSYND